MCVAGYMHLCVCVHMCMHTMIHTHFHSLSQPFSPCLQNKSKLKLTSSNSIFSFLTLFSAMGVWGGAVCWHARNPVIVWVYMLL